MSSSPNPGLPAKTWHSSPRIAGSSPPSSTEALDHGLVFETGLFRTHSSAGQEIRLWPMLVNKLGLNMVILRLLLRLQPQRLRSIKTSSKPSLMSHSPKSTIFIPLAAAIAPNRGIICPRTTIPVPHFKPWDICPDLLLKTTLSSTSLIKI